MTAPRREAIRLRRPGMAPVDVDAVVHHPSGDRGDGGPVEKAAGPGVVLAHGAGGDLGDGVLVALADVVARAGHVAVRTNLGYRQQRASGPPPRAEATVGDLAASLAALSSRWPERGWVLGGRSYGGRVATMVAADTTAGPVHPVGLLCVSYPLHPPGRPDRLRVAHLPAITVPILVLQGTADPFGGPDDLAPHLAGVDAPVTVVAVDGGDHGLHVPRTRSADGATHRADEVVAALAGDVGAWLDGLGA